MPAGPERRRGGAPATNPGPNAEHWERGQVGETGGNLDSPQTSPEDRQAKRMAYTGNATIFPRNKFNAQTLRRNILVSSAGVDGSARGSSGTILATEFVEVRKGWEGILNNNLLSKSHRPITPFIAQDTSDVYNAQDVDQPAFLYPPVSSIAKVEELGPNMIEDARTSLNAVGRHHPGSKDKAYGGSVNFVFVDGHVERMTVIESIKNRKWGDRFHSITGRNNRVIMDLN